MYLFVSLKINYLNNIRQCNKCSKNICEFQCINTNVSHFRSSNVFLTDITDCLGIIQMLDITHDLLKKHYVIYIIIQDLFKIRTFQNFLAH